MKTLKITKPRAGTKNWLFEVIGANRTQWHREPCTDAADATVKAATWFFDLYGSAPIYLAGDVDTSIDVAGVPVRKRVPGGGRKPLSGDRRASVSVRLRPDVLAGLKRAVESGEYRSIGQAVDALWDGTKKPLG